MANWNLPTTTTNYLAYPGLANDRDVDAITFGYGSPTNLPIHAMRFNRSVNIFEEWDGTVWNPAVLGIAGGGTGGNTAAAARTALGLGSMATQNSNAVAITGGSITGVNFSASDITSGVIALSRGGTGASLALGAPGTVLLSNGTQVVFAPGTQIAELNASNLVTGTVPLSRLPAGIAYLDQPNTFTGKVVISPNPDTLANSFSIVSILPTFSLVETDWTVNNKTTLFAVQNGNFVIQSRNDDFSGGINLLHIDKATQILTGNGAGLSNLNGSFIATGTVAPQRLGAGVPSVVTFLRGDGNWVIPEASSGVPVGLIAMFDTGCPTGWTRVAALDNRFPIGGTGFGATGGSDTHAHPFDQQSDNGGAHSHSFSGSGSGQTEATGEFQNQYAVQSGSLGLVEPQHHHNFNVNVAGNTDGVGDHAHRVRGNTSVASNMPPYLSVVFCRKD